MIELIKENPHEIELLAIGPLTNIAMAIRLDPSIPSLLKKVYVMGGTDSAVGNESHAAEFNFYADPEAAQIVFSSFQDFETTRIKLITWECSVKNAISWSFYDQLCDKNTRMGCLFKEIGAAMEKLFRESG